MVSSALSLRLNLAAQTLSAPRLCLTNEVPRAHAFISVSLSASFAIRPFVLWLVLVMVGLTPARAAEVTWLPAATGDWFNSANWSGGTIPGASDTTYISGTGTAVVPSGTSATSDTVNLGQFGAGSLIVSGTMSSLFFSSTSSSATISGPQAVWSTDGIFTYSSTITVNNGGRFSTRLFQMINPFASSNRGLFLVTGSGSRLDVSGESATIEGGGGYSVLSVLNGGGAGFQDLTFNARSGAVISGTGSRLDAKGVILNSPSQEGFYPGLQVENGGALTTVSTTINSVDSPGIPIVRVTGTGSRWDNQDGMEFFANGEVRVENGATLVTGSMTMSSSGTATLVLSGGTLQGRQSYSSVFQDPFVSDGVGIVLGFPGGTINTAGFNLFVQGAVSGGGSLTKVGSGTLIASALTHTGTTFVREGTMGLSGPASLAAGVYVGTQSGDAASVQMNVAADVYAGSVLGASGTVSALTPFIWNNGNKKLVLGDAGRGYYLGADTSFTTTGEVTLGNQATGVGVFDLTGDSASASLAGFVVGQEGAGMVALTGGAALTGTLAVLAFGSSSSGLALVSGTSFTTDTSSRWTVTDLRIGNSGTADLIVTNGGQVRATKIASGIWSTGRGTVQVGQGSSLKASDLENVLGAGGAGSLTVSAGGVVEFGGLTLGDSSSSSGVVEITGTGSRLSLTAANTPFTIGRGGYGSATVLDGGALTTNSSVVVAGSANSIGSINISGAGSTFSGTGSELDRNLTLGQAGNAEFVVANGGRVSFRDITVAGTAGSVGTLFLNGGSAGSGTLEFRNLVAGAGNANIVFDGGTLRATGTIFPQVPYDNTVGLGTGAVALGAGGGSLDLNGRRVVFHSGFTGVGHLTLASSGTLMLRATSTHSGTTSVLQSTMRAEQTGVFSAASSIVLGDTSEAILDLNDLNQTIGSLGGGEAARITLGSGSLTTGANHASSVFSGSISGSGGLVKVGSGTMTLTGSNSHTAGTFFRGGAVEFNSLDNLGSGALSFDGGTLRYATGNTADISTRSVTFASGGATIDIQSGTVTFANSLGNGGSGSLTKTGTGTLVLTGSNAFSGTTFVEQGLLQVSHANALPDTGDVVLSSAGSAYFAVRNAAVSIGSLSGGSNSGIVLGRIGYLSVGADNSSSTFDGVFQSDAFINGGGLLKVGTGTLTLTQGGFVGETAGVLGGVMILDGGGMSAGNLVINNNAHLEVRDGGAVVTYYNGGIGANDLQGASMLVTGNGSRWEDVSDFITVSNQGSGTLTVASGGTVIQKAGSGTVRLGASGFLGTLNVGEFGTPSSTAGTVQAAVVVGEQFGGLVNFNQANSTTFSASLTGNLSVDQRGSGLTLLTGSSNFSGALNTHSGTLQISNGGRVTNTTTSGIAASGSTASLVVTGSGADWTSLSDIMIGHNGGTGYLTIRDGATASDTFALVGRTAGGEGHVTVTGPDSTWTHSAGLVIGMGGAGTMLVENGGLVSNADGTIGGNMGASGSVRVTGTGSQWTSSSYLVVGNAGSGTLSADAGGVVRVGTSGSGVLTLGNAGAGAGTLNIGAAVGQEAGEAGQIQASAVTAGAGSGNRLVNFNHTGSNYIFAPNLTGSLRVENNAGRTILTGSNTYTGDTMVSAGTLLVNGSLAGDVLVENGGTLGGDGVLGGAVTVQSGGMFSPGNSPGQITLMDSLTMADGSFLLIELGGTEGGLYDQIDVQGFFTAGGTLNLMLIDGFVPLEGASFQVFNGISPGFDAGGFAFTTNLGGGLQWDTSALASSGIVSVIPEPGTAVLVALGVGALAFRRKKRG